MEESQIAQEEKADKCQGSTDGADGGEDGISLRGQADAQQSEGGVVTGS